MTTGPKGFEATTEASKVTAAVEIPGRASADSARNCRHSTSRRIRYRALVATVLFISGFASSARTVDAGPSAAGPQTSTSFPPYTASGVYEHCDAGAGFTCVSTQSADHHSGSISTDLTVVGSKGARLYCWPVCSVGVYDQGGGAGGDIEFAHYLSKTVTSLTYTFSFETGESRAEATLAAGAVVDLYLGGSARCPLYCRASGAFTTRLASSTTQPVSGPGTTTLTIKLADAYGGKISPGNVYVSARLTAWGGGPGTSHASSSVRLKSITQMIEA